MLPNAVRSLVMNLLALKWTRRLNPELEGDLTLIKTGELEEPRIRFVFLDAEGRVLAALAQGKIDEDQRRVSIRRGEDEYFIMDIVAYGNFVAGLTGMVARNQ